MEYIEKKMSSKNATTTSTSSLISTSTSQNVTRTSSPFTNPTTDNTSLPTTSDPISTPSTTSNPSATADPRFGSDLQIRGATLGKLHEVDLGEEAKMRNIARTEAATRRLEGKEPIQEEDDSKGGRKKGKWKRRRRNSQDLQRDRLVEEVLKETRCKSFSL
jgi:hypothetical protein